MFFLRPPPYTNLITQLSQRLDLTTGKQISVRSVGEGFIDENNDTIMVPIPQEKGSNITNLLSVVYSPYIMITSSNPVTLTSTFSTIITNAAYYLNGKTYLIVGAYGDFSLSSSTGYLSYEYYLLEIENYKIINKKLLYGKNNVSYLNWSNTSDKTSALYTYPKIRKHLSYYNNHIIAYSPSSTYSDDSSKISNNLQLVDLSNLSVFNITISSGTSIFAELKDYFVQYYTSGDYSYFYIASRSNNYSSNTNTNMSTSKYNEYIFNGLDNNSVYFLKGSRQTTTGNTSLQVSMDGQLYVRTGTGSYHEGVDIDGVTLCRFDVSSSSVLKSEIGTIKFINRQNTASNTAIYLIRIFSDEEYTYYLIFEEVKSNMGTLYNKILKISKTFKTYESTIDLSKYGHLADNIQYNIVHYPWYIGTYNNKAYTYINLGEANATSFGCILEIDKSNLLISYSNIDDSTIESKVYSFSFSTQDFGKWAFYDNVQISEEVIFTSPKILRYPWVIDTESSGIYYLGRVNSNNTVLNNGELTKMFPNQTAASMQIFTNYISKYLANRISSSNGASTMGESVIYAPYTIISSKQPVIYEKNPVIFGSSSPSVIKTFWEQAENKCIYMSEIDLSEPTKFMFTSSD